MILFIQSPTSKPIKLYILFALVFAVALQFFAHSGPASASVYLKENPELLMFTIHVPMTIGEQARVVFPDGESVDVGKVRGVPTKSRYPGFTASKYGIGGQVIATAANAHHIQVSVENGEGRTISLIPSETFVAASGMGTSFVVEGIGGEGLWGKYAPFVSSPVYIINKVGVPVLFNSMELFKYATALEIRVYRPGDEIDYIEIENREGGLAWYHDGKGDHQFAVVESGVTGTGRFEGSLYQSRGKVRANHPGVICVSTTNKFDIGGFQIIPLTHTYSKEMQKTRRMKQYIVLRGVDFEDLTGHAPFFRGFIRPGESEGDSSRAGSVVCMIGGQWGELPLVSGLTENSLAEIEAFRIFLR
ncbi:MAG: hypothetical protein LBL73_05555 [Synergistaceae bacterium]|jgi:hypothetical protein|nr:hypothetical protein [Synergistaceae bacterium]